MANLSISLDGINQALNNLNYKENSKKFKVISAIKAYYISEESINNIISIDTDTLIEEIWNLEETPLKIRTKRRNFSSIKSSINADLKKLSTKDENPENIVITDTNIFDMSEEAKANLLNSFSDALKTGDIDIDQATSILTAITDFLDNIESGEKDNKSKELISQIKKVLDKISSGILPDGGGSSKGGKKIEGYGKKDEGDGTDQGSGDGEGGESTEDTEEIELDEDEELEEINEIEDDLDEIELDEDEELEEIDDYDEDTEEIEIDDEEKIEELDEFEEVDELDDIEEVEDDENTEDTEEIELDEDEELEEINEIEDDLDEIELDDDEELEEIDDYDEDTEEIEIDDDDELKQVDGLTEEELEALEDFNEKKKLAEQFDEMLAEADKKYNTYVTVPAGEYTIGTKKGLKSNLELQKFNMPKVFIGKFPITNSLFEAFVEKTGYITTAEKKGSGNVFFGKFKKGKKASTWKKNAGSNIIEKASWYQPEGPESTIHGKKYHPVVQVSVEDAFAFASWIGRRLPSEAEWEAAARTDLGYKYPWGNTWENKACNVDKNGVAGTTAVDYYAGYDNEFKISDLLGNIMEWTSDIEKPPIKTKSKQNYNVAKGGGWNSDNNISISSRALFKPGFTSNTIGFRCISEIFK
ncbi:MAG: formylglycine-generating enzyme family protein [Desulfobacteraceae bacterium]|nr:formylglycine-generating enzyme family protein [Desulfobacteraceae bacterium]